MFRKNITEMVLVVFVFCFVLIQTGYGDPPVDSDNDGMPDTWEETYSLNPLFDDAQLDADNDTLVNLDEFFYNTNPTNPDTDNDGLSDFDEVSVFSSSISDAISVALNDSRTQARPDAASNGTNYFTSWSSYNQDGGGYGIYAQFLDNEGFLIDDEFGINNTTSNNQFESQAASDGTNYFIVWESNLQDGDEHGIYGKLIDASGITILSEFQIHSYTTGDQQNPQIASNGTTYFVTWQSTGQDGDGTGVFGQLFDNEGIPIGAELQINQYTATDQATPAVASDGNSYLVVWSSTGQDGSANGIYARRYDGVGQAMGGEFQVHTTLSADQNNPKVASFQNNYLVAWTSLHLDGVNRNIFGQMVTGAGVLSGDELQIDSNPSADNYCIGLDANTAQCLVTWNTLHSDGSRIVYGQFISRNGSKTNDQFVVDEVDENVSTTTSVVSNGNNYFVAWRQSSPSDIYAAFVTLNGHFTNPLSPDTDNDGLTDGEEILTYGTSPTNPDTDSDGLLDGAEVVSHGTSPTNSDTDNDGLSDMDEVVTYGTNPTNADTDNDTLLDNWEVYNGYDPLVNDSALDYDNDGLDGILEAANSTNGTNPDTDNDALLDGEEVLIYGTIPTDPDSDNDGLLDSDEVVTYGTNPIVADTDNDILSDSDEIVTYGTNPVDNDTDNDGLSDGDEVLSYGTNPANVDTDNDGLSDSDEVITYGTNPIVADTDNDGLSDIDEIFSHGTSPTNSDTDNDGLSDMDEVVTYGTNPTNADTDNDTLLDNWEVYNGYDPLVNDSALDHDTDGLDGLLEVTHGTAGNNPDSDNDGLSDGEEVLIHGTLPTNPDSDGDTMQDEWEITYGLNPLADDAQLDPDQDTLVNLDENFYNTNPLAADTDNDGLLDNQELPQISAPIDISNDYWGGGIGRGAERIHNPKIIWNGDYGFVVWRKEVIRSSPFWPVSYTSYSYLRGCIIDKAGNRISSNLYISEEPHGNYLEDFSAAALGDSFICVWDQFTTDFANKMLYAKTISNDGSQVSSVITIANVPEPEHWLYPIYPIVSANNSEYLVIWKETNEDSSYSLFGQLIDETGDLKNNSFLIAEDAAGNPSNFSISSTGENFLVTWKNTALFGLMLDNDGVPVGNSFQISNDAVIQSSLTTDGVGYLAMWDQASSGNRQLVGQYIDDDGSLNGGQILINESSLEHQESAICSDGLKYMACWYEHDPSVSTSAVHFQFFSAAGDLYAIDYSFPNEGWLDEDPVCAFNGESFNLLWVQINDYDYEGILLSVAVEYPYAVDPTNPDSDNDGLSDGDEILIHNTNPATSDTDRDGLSDSDEILVYGTLPTNSDMDNDGLLDGEEVLIYGTLPMDADTDNDTLLDGWEIFNGYDPLVDDAALDIDNDGLNALLEITYSTAGNNPDTDNDGLSDGDEVFTHTTSPLNPDTDNDGLSDGDEVLIYNTNPHVVDTDNDTLLDGDEVFIYNTLPSNSDSDNDTLRDDWEIEYGYNPLVGDSSLDIDNDGLNGLLEVTYSTAGNNPDTDNDGLLDGDEVFTYNSSPTDIDTDDDGLLDGEEVLTFGTNPADSDTDNDGLPDFYEVSIASPVMSDEITVHPHYSNTQARPAAASNGVNYLATWSSYTQDGSGYGIYARLFDNEGNSIDNEFGINNTTTNNQFESHAASDGTNYFVVWESNQQDGEAHGVYGELIDSSGITILSEFRVNSYTTGDQQNPQVASNGEIYFVTWHSQGQDGDGTGIFGQIFDNEGIKTGIEFQINEYTTSNQEYPAVTSDGNSVLVVWSSNEQDGSGYGIYARRYDSNGQAVGGEFQVHTTVSDDQKNPKATKVHGGYLIAWTSNHLDGTNRNIFAQRVDGAGNLIGNELRVDSNSSADNYNIGLDSSNNHCLMTWNTEHAGGTSVIYAHLFSGSGIKINEQFVIDNVSENVSSTTSVASDGNSYFVLWRQGNITDIYAKRITLENGYFTDPLNPDTDNDGLSDGDEVIMYGTSPTDFDTDNDGLSDGEEVVMYSSSPTAVDTDNDGLSDGEEVLTYGTLPNDADTDNDTLLDGWEIANGYDPFLDDSARDDDNDGLNAALELLHGSNYLIPDTDNDGLLDGEEILTYGTLPTDPDTDDDSLSDLWEVINGYNPLIDDSIFDNDNDGLPNIFELDFGTDRNNPDTDNDGLNDGQEVGTAYETLPPSVLMPPSNPWSFSAASNGANNLLVWRQYTSQEAGEDILALYFNKDGQPIGSRFRVNSFTPLDQEKSRVASDGMNYLIVWEHGSGFIDIYGKLLDAAGNTLKEDFQIDISMPNTPHDPAVASNGDSYLVVWHRATSSTSPADVFGQVLDSQGTLIGPEFTVNTFTHGYQYHARVASNGDSYLVIWESSNSGPYEIYGMLLDATGQPLSTEFQINVLSLGNLIHSFPTVISNGNDYAVMWIDYQNWSIKSNVFVRMIDNTGSFLTDELTVNLPETAGFSPGISSINGNDFCVVWGRAIPDELDPLMGQVLSRKGLRFGAPFVITPRTTLNRPFTMVPTGNEVFIIWRAVDTYIAKIARNAIPDISPLNPDSDSDGLTDGEEVMTFGTIPGNPDTDNDSLIDGYEIYDSYTDPLLFDTDNDTSSDGDEVIASTDPLDAASLFQMADMSDASNVLGYPSILLVWESVDDKMYTVWVQTDLMGPDFVILRDNISGIGGYGSCYDEGGGPNNIPTPALETGVRLYKISVKQ